MKHIAKTIFAASVLAFAAHTYAADTSTANVSPAERAKIEAVVHDYLIKKPEVIMEAVQQLQQRQYQQAEKTVKQTQSDAASYASTLFQQANDPVGGNPNGAITVAEFFDYQCPHCIDMVPTLDAILKANPNVRVVYKEFPIRGPMSELAARAALAANMQGKYSVFSHAIFAANKPISQEMLEKLASSNGIDVEKMKKDMNSTSVSDQLKATMKLAQSLHLFGTPALFVGKTDGKGEVTYIPGQTDQKQLQAAIDKAGK